MNRHLRRAMVLVGTAVLAAGTAVFIAPTGANAHGAMMMPGSRTYLCWLDGIDSTGAVNPKNPACAAAVAQSGATSLYNWFAVLRSDGAGRTSGFIADGQLCSGGTGGPYNFTGFNLARSDWPKTHLTAGANVTFKYNNWAKHPGTFYLYVTKNGYDPTQPLKWSDLESTPFATATNPASSGGPGTADGHYYWSGNLPSGKSGNHVIYSVWSRSDSQETFYGCSDVAFDGGNGEVTGVGSGTGSSATPSAGTSSAAPSSPAASASSSSGTGTGQAQCTASYAIASSWNGGFQATVTITNSGSSAIGSWTASWTLASGQSISQVWNGTLTTSGTSASVKNVSWNGSVSPGGTTSFGFIGGGSASVPAVNCTSP